MIENISEKQFKNGLFYILPVIIGAGLPILTLPLFTRALSVEEFGVFALSQVYAVFINGISNFGLTTGYERNFFENDNKFYKAGLLFSTLLFVLCTFILFASITFIFKDQLSKLIIGSDKYSNILFWSYCSSGISSLKMFYLIYLKNTENAKAYVWFTIDENLLGVLISLIMVVYYKIGVLGLILGPLIASTFVFILLTKKFLTELPNVLNYNLLKESLLLSIPLTPKIFLGVIGNQFDKLMIGQLNTIGGAGIYNLGQKFANIVFTFMTAIQNVFAPQVYKRMFNLDKNTGGLSIGSYLTPFIYMSVFCALIVSLFSEEFIFILTPKSYHDSVEIVSLLSMLYATYFFSKQPQLIYAKRTIITTWITLFSITLNILINIPFIYYFGMLGAAYGTLIAGLITGILSFKISQKYYEIKWEYSKIILIYVIYFLFSFMLIILKRFHIDYEIRFCVKVFAVLNFIVIGIRLKYFSKTNIQLIKSIFKLNKTP
jgi:O-antigen/teichoic acid export membrane protein